MKFLTKVKETIKKILLWIFDKSGSCGCGCGPDCK